MTALRACLAAPVLALAACSSVDLDAPCRPGAALPVDRFDFGFVGEETHVELPIGVLGSCRLPTAAVRVLSPSGDERAPTRVEVAVDVFGNPTARVDFIADVEGSWSVEARFSQSLGRVQREVPIVGDLRGAPRAPFPFVPEGPPCEVPLLTAQGSALCFDDGVVRWPRAEGGQEGRAQATALWVSGERVWLARDTLFTLSATGDGGFVAGPAVVLPDVGLALSVSGAAQRAVVVQPGQTAVFTLDDAGAWQRGRVTLTNDVVAAAASGPGTVSLTPAPLGLDAGFIGFAQRLCQLDRAVADGGCQDVALVTGHWRSTEGLWLRLSAPVGFRLQFVDPRAAPAVLLSGATATVPLVERESDAPNQPMTMHAFSAPPRDGGPLVLLPRLGDNAVSYEAVPRQPAPGSLFVRATGTHVFYRDTRDGGAPRWSFLRRAAR